MIYYYHLHASHRRSFILFFFLFSLWKLYRGRRSTFSASLYFKDVAFARPERVSCSCGTAQVYGGDAKLQQTLRCVSWKRLLKLCWGASKHSSTLLPAQQLEAPQFKGSRWHLKAPYQRHFQICTLCDAGLQWSSRVGSIATTQQSSPPVMSQRAFFLSFFPLCSSAQFMKRRSSLAKWMLRRMGPLNVCLSFSVSHWIIFG